MQSALEMIKMAYLQIFDENITLDVVYAACLAVLFYKRHEWKTSFYLVGLPAIMAAVLLLNPVYAYLYARYVQPEYVEYSRQSWLLFIYIVIAYTTVQLFLSAREKKGKAAILIFMICVLLSQDYRGLTFYFINPQNQYKISEDAVLAYETIAKDCHIKEQGELVASDAQKRVVIWTRDGNIHTAEMNEDGKLFYGLRMYTTDFIVSMHTSGLDELESGQCRIADTFDPTGDGTPDYLIVADNGHLLAKRKQDGWRLVENIGNYLVYAKDE